MPKDRGSSASRCTSWVIVVTEGMLKHGDLAGSGTKVLSRAAKVPSASRSRTGTRHTGAKRARELRGGGVSGWGIVRARWKISDGMVSIGGKGETLGGA
jgi:hypothetical protein